MATITTTFDGRHTKAIVSSEVTVPIFVGRSAVVVAVPGAGGSMLVEASFSMISDVLAGTAAWFPWDAGTVTVPTLQTLNRATAVRFTATTAAGCGEVAQ